MAELNKNAPADNLPESKPTPKNNETINIETVTPDNDNLLPGKPETPEKTDPSNKDSGPSGENL